MGNVVLTVKETPASGVVEFKNAAADAVTLNNIERLKRMSDELKELCAYYTAEDYANSRFTQDIVSEMTEEIAYLLNNICSFILSPRRTL